MIKFKNNKGITITTLIITVVVLITIAGTAAYTGMDVYQDAKEEAFVQELQMIQNAVNNEHSKIELASLEDENEDGAMDYIYNLTWGEGKGIEEIPVGLPSKIRDIIGEGNGYRYFDKTDLLDIGIQGVSQSVLINFTTRDVISAKGFNGKYNLSEFNETTNYNSNVTLTIDNVPIPNGFVYLTGNKDNGLVIKNIKDGNEFVWVPVNNNTLPMFEYDETTGNYTSKLYNWNAWKPNETEKPSEMNKTTYNEPHVEPNYNNITDNMQEEFNKMAKSVEKHGGFYVGRYETSWTGGKVASVQNATAMTTATDLGAGWEDVYTTTTNKNEATWYGLYEKQKELYSSDTDSVISGMIYGCQWDAIMKWMKDIPNDSDISKLFIKYSYGMGIFNESELGFQPTGQYSLKNIFDLAGNYMEYTQEKMIRDDGEVVRTRRGGSAHSTGSLVSASIRSGYNTYVTQSTDSSRLQLYIKVD